MMTQEPKHTISAGGVVLGPDGRVLVVNQRGRAWSLPKGHIDPGEDALTAAKREIREESGVKQLELISELGSYERYKLSHDGGDDVSEQKTIVLFLFRTGETNLRPDDPHNPEARWVPPEEVADMLTHRKDKEFFLSLLPRLQ